ncbi:hypothetical protein ACJQWK_11856 [Exserohilum turcicum]
MPRTVATTPPSPMDPASRRRATSVPIRWTPPGTDRPWRRSAAAPRNAAPCPAHAPRPALDDSYKPSLPPSKEGIKR